MYRSCLILAVFLVSNLTACGFHLAGNSSIPPRLNSIQLIADDLDSQQISDLSRQLTQAGASLVDNQLEDAVRLAVEIKSLPERNLVDTAGSGKTIIRLSRRLSYNLESTAGEIMVEQSTILRQKDIELDSNNLAGLDYERQIAEALPDKELLGQLIFQLLYFQN